MFDGNLTLDQIMSIPAPGPGEAGNAPQWSPDGSRILFVSSLGGSPDIWSISPQGGFPARVTLGLGTADYAASHMPLWSPDGQHISYISNKTGTNEVWLWHANGDPESQLTNLGANIQSVCWAPDGKSLVLSGNRYGGYDIYRIDLPSGDATRLTDDPLYEVNPVFTPDGKRIIYIRLNETWEDHQIVQMNSDGTGSKVIAEDSDFFDYSFGPSLGVPQVSPDGKWLLFRSQRSGYTNYWKMSAEGGEPSPLAPEEAEQSGAAWSPDGSEAAYVSNRNGTLELRIASAEGGESRSLFNPGMGVCTAPGWSPDGSRICFLHGTPTAPDDLWVVSAKEGEPRQLTFSLPEGGLENRLAAPSKVAYASFDGLTINGYLYAPKDRSRRYPGIVFTHGGPTSQFFDNYQPYVQYLVQRGYVVLQPNVRGSSGYGKTFEEANDGDWGGGDLKDAVAGADFLKSLSYVDPDRMGVTGTSYGGIMSMNAVCFAPGVFQAAVPMSGYAEWPVELNRMAVKHIKLLEHELGRYEDNKETWHRCSAIYSARDARTPTFVLHGEGRDPHSDASREFAEALKKEGKVVQYKAYPNDGYYVVNRSNIREMLKDIGDFFDKYLKNGLH